jgi:long-chain acyl-CoA synthetase
MTALGDYTIGHVGAPLLVNEVKLLDVPEICYMSKDQPFPRGEICFKDNNCFKGYYKDPAKTDKTIDKDGWVHSGDVGQWNENGNMIIIDRKKHIFKLAQGEYIPPKKIETLVMTKLLM